jgi:hypothetical protein
MPTSIALLCKKENAPRLYSMQTSASADYVLYLSKLENGH